MSIRERKLVNDLSWKWRIRETRLQMRNKCLPISWFQNQQEIRLSHWPTDKWIFRIQSIENKLWKTLNLDIKWVNKISKFPRRDVLQRETSEFKYFKQNMVFTLLEFLTTMKLKSASKAGAPSKVKSSFVATLILTRTNRIETWKNAFVSYRKANV